MLFKYRLQAMLSTTLVVLAAALRVSCTSEVMEANSSFPCCGNLAIKFDPNCETTWSIDGKTFATPDGNYMSPCRKIEGGQMTLESCLDVNATVICRKETGEIQETRIYHHGRPCSSSVSNHVGRRGLAGSLLLAVAIGGFFVLH